MRSYLCLAVLVAAWGPSPGSAQAPPERDSVPVFVLEPIEVEGRADDLAGLVTSSSVGYVGYRDLSLRPLTRPGELLETVPGMILTQHSGSGKSNQMFVRGFNLDHGTDFATWVDGMPVNIASHAHGQGYTDLNFIVPELVDHIEYSLGTHHAELGDFGSAGGAQMRLRQRLERPIASLGVGANGHRRLVAATSAELGGIGTLLAGGELHGYDGPWEVPEELSKRSGMLRFTREGPRNRWTLLALGYANRWNASDQIPRRAVAAGRVSRFGQIDPTLGGESSRYSLSGTWSRSVAASSQQVDVYAIRYGLDLFSNFTYRLDDALQGDQIRQRDDGRWTVGANVVHHQSLGLLGRSHDLALGAQLRSDEARLVLARTRDRAPVRVVRADDVAQRSVGLFAELVSVWSGVVRTSLGLRGDAYRFGVTSDRAANTGDQDDAIVSPKASIAFGPWAGTELYLSGGLGFHSNDGRGTVATLDPATGASLAPVDPLARSYGAELGVRVSAVEGLRSTATLWWVDLDSELVYVGDAGSTEPSDPSRRTGLTLTNFYRFGDEWRADLDLSLTRARFRDVPSAQDRIPGAMENVLAAGISRDPLEDGLTAALRLRRFGSYPLVEDGSERASASALLNASVGYRLGAARLRLSVLNVLDEAHSDIQYFYASRLAGEPVGGVDDLHFHPAEPRQLRIELGWGL